MDNQQFRRLLFTPTENGPTTASAETVTSTSRPANARPAALGSRRAAFANMAPRSIKKTSSDIYSLKTDVQAAKHKSSAVKSTKLAPGYTDRVLVRGGETEQQDERAAKIAVIEQQLKEEKLDRRTFERLRDEITAGDVAATHLVKGLDRQLLARVRKGEDVMTDSASKPTASKPQSGALANIEDDLDALEARAVAPVEKATTDKKGQLAISRGTKRSRDAIVAELKAQRQAAAAARAAERPGLSDKFKDISETSLPSNALKTYIDHKGREIMIIRDEHGRTKKVRRRIEHVQQPSSRTDEHVSVSAPRERTPSPPIELSASAPPPGDGLPEKGHAAPKPEVEADESESDDDIFEGAGTSYNPLGDDGNDDDNDDDDDTTDAPQRRAPVEPRSAGPMSASDKHDGPSQRTNYFSTTRTDDDETKVDPLSNRMVLAAIKRAGVMAKTSHDPAKAISAADGAMSADADADADMTEEQRARLRKRAAMLSTSDRDLEDMDLGFGAGRFDDDIDGDPDARGKGSGLSTWKGLGQVEGEGDDDGEERPKKDKGPKKRARKRKGDKDSLDDVMGVLEARKA